MLAPGNTEIKEEPGNEPTSELSLNDITRDLRAASLPATVEAFSDSNKVIIMGVLMRLTYVNEEEQYA